MHIHPVFHDSLLEPHVPNTFSGRVVDIPLPIQVDGLPKFEVDSILDSLLGPIPTGISASLVSTPIPHLCASRLVYTLCFYRVLLVLPLSVCVFVL